MAERVEEASLTVNALRCLVVADLVDAAICSGCHGTFDETVWVVNEDFHPHRSRTTRGRSVPAVVRRFAQEEWGSLDGEPHDAAEVPQFDGSKALCIPPRGRGGVGHGEHHRDHGTVSGCHRLSPLSRAEIADAPDQPGKVRTPSGSCTWLYTYEPKRAGRGSDARACFGSQQGSAKRLPEAGALKGMGPFRYRPRGWPPATGSGLMEK